MTKLIKLLRKHRCIPSALREVAWSLLLVHCLTVGMLAVLLQ